MLILIYIYIITQTLYHSTLTKPYIPGKMEHREYMFRSSMKHCVLALRDFVETYVKATGDLFA
jgi:hypothetical protein